jgi:hypothetical protein
MLDPLVWSFSPVDFPQLHADDIRIARPDPLQRRRFRRAVQMNPHQRGLRAVIDDALHLFHVDVAAREHPEDVSQHAGPVPVSDRQHMRGRAASEPVDHIGHFARGLKGPDDTDDLMGDRDLRLLGGRADVVGAVDAGRLHDGVGKPARPAGRLVLKDVEPDP